MLGNNQRKTKTYVSVSQLSGCVVYFHCVVLMVVFTFPSFLRRCSPGRSCLYTSGGVVVEEVLRNRAFLALHDILFSPLYFRFGSTNHILSIHTFIIRR